MSGRLTLLLWLADIAGSLGVVIAIGCIAIAAASMILLIRCAIEEDPDSAKRWLRMMTLPACLFLVAAVLTPSRTTVYVYAAMSIGEAASVTEDFQLIRRILTKKLREMAEEGSKK